MTMLRFRFHAPSVELNAIERPSEREDSDKGREDGDQEKEDEHDGSDD